MDEFESVNTTLGTKTSKVGSAQFDFQQGVNANLAESSWGIIFFVYA
jgi:hypothetical protein